MKEKLKNIFFKFWYWYLSFIDKNADIIFMNYGYSKDNNKIELEETDEKNRYSIQLYHLVATGVDIKERYFGSRLRAWWWLIVYKSLFVTKLCNRC